MPDHVFVWVDIEDFPDVTDDDDVEDFPTILIQVGEQVRFFGPMLPHIAHLEKVIAAVGKSAKNITPAQGPNLNRLLREQAY